MQQSLVFFLIQAFIVYLNFKMPLKPQSVDDEFLKNPGLKREQLDHLTEWMGKQPHLPKISELEMILFLHSCFYRLEATKTCIDTFYTVRTHVPEIFAGRDPTSTLVEDTLKVMVYTPLPEVTDEGHRVIYCRFMITDPSQFVFQDCLKVFGMSMDLWLLQTGTAPGHVIIFDMKDVVLGHMARLGLMTMKKFLFYLQEALPVRLKGLHYMNAVPFMDKILALMKPFMKKELMDVLHIHQQNDTLFPFVPQRCLPKDYGGNCDTVEELHATIVNQIKENRLFFLEEERDMRVVEARRPGKPKDAGNLFGMEGSFKKLDID